MKNETWCVVFRCMQTGKSEDREYPKQCQWSSRKELNIFLQNRSFLKEMLVEEIVLIDLNKIKYETADLLGQLIYAK